MRPSDRDPEWTDEQRAQLLRLFDRMLSGSPVYVDDRQRQVIEGILLQLVEEGWIEFSGVDEHGTTYRLVDRRENQDE